MKLKPLIIILGLSLSIPFFLACGGENVQNSSQAVDGRQLDSLRKKPQVVLESLQKQIQKDPEDYSLYQDRSELYYAMDSLDRSLEDIDRAIRLYDKGPDLYYWKGFLSFVGEDTAAAKRAYLRARDLGSQNPEVFYQLGQIYFFQGKYDKALTQYEEAGKYGPDQALYPFAKGFLEESRENYGQAKKHYLSSLEIDSTFDKALLRLHEIYLSYHRNEREAMKYNDQLLRNQLGHPLGNYNEGNYQLRRAQRFKNGNDLEGYATALNEAILHFTIAVDNDPDFALAYYARGMAYFDGRQRIGEALEDFRKTVELRPGYAPGHFMLGSIYEGTGDLSSALTHYQEAYRLKPEGEGFEKAVKDVKARLK